MTRLSLSFRHSRESGDPVDSGSARGRRDWAPAFAGMTRAGTFAALGALLVACAPLAAEPAGECDDPITQQAMNMCAARDFAASDAALNAQWAETTAAMKARDERVDRAYDSQPGYYETLLEGQRAWLTFRDAQCRAESFMARGGTLQPLLDAHCRTHLTELRIQQLRDLLAEP